MNVRFFFQDPSDDHTIYLFEAIISAITGAESWHGIYAFASRNGVENLLSDEAVETFFKGGGQADVLVGMDAVTNRLALERLQHFEKKYKNFQPAVFWNTSPGLFHPKLSLFSYPDGRRTLIVGSGNLSPGGFSQNFEAYTVITTNPDELVELSSLNNFLSCHAANIRKIDNAALIEAAKNTIQFKKARLIPPQSLALPTAATQLADRFLVAQVPDAAGRWQQLHLNKHVISDFFRVSDPITQRIFLTPVTSGGNRKEEEIRRVVYSKSNKNYKIEISEWRGITYPSGGRPIIIFGERQLRTFDYLVRMPGEPGYAQMLALTNSHPKLGKGLPRVIVSRATISSVWPNCPLLALSAPPSGGL